jgi:DNA-binding CsgD family transcriptional regulator/pimeloyl-ACP methyl ester carboxylesterase
MVDEQAIGFVTHRGRRIAYAVTGAGPLLLFDSGRAHHLEVFWRHPRYRRIVQELCRRFTVVRWDRPGFGLSDRRADLSPGAELALVEKIVAHVRGNRVAILAAGDAAPTMIRYAARHPERVSRIALFATAANYRLVPGLPRTALQAMTRADAPVIHQVVAAAQSAGCEPEVCSWLAAALEASADAPTMGALAAGCDAGRDVAAVRAPTRVLHRAGDPVVESGLGRALAASIRGAEFVELDGRSHLLYEGDTDALLRAVIPFLTERQPNEAAPLSRRELEVAHMVTLGLTNAEIGLRLAIQRRTVDAHLEHIRAKLGVRSRTRIAAWATRSRAAATSASA